MTDADGAALLAAIIADPADDLPRLAYADLCDERGNSERAEFIRVQLELHWNRTPGHPRRPKASLENDARQDWLEARERLLWRPPYKGLPHPMEGWLCTTGQFAPDGRQLQVRRGFVHAVRCTLAEWERSGKELVRCHPLGRVELSDCEPERWEETDLGWYRYDRVDPAKPWSTRRYADDLPPELWDLLELPLDPLMARYEPNRYKTAATAEAAHDALSAACLKWARSP